MDLTQTGREDEVLDLAQGEVRSQSGRTRYALQDMAIEKGKWLVICLSVAPMLSQEKIDRRIAVGSLADA